MRLRNKKTGDIWEFDGISMAISDSTKEKLGARGCSGSCYARSISELNEEWEDAEPLIKDKKIRKAVRAWWESIPCEPADKLVLYKKNQDLAVGVYTIYCGAIYPEGTLKEGKTYTITELCGEIDCEPYKLPEGWH